MKPLCCRKSATSVTCNIKMCKLKKLVFIAIYLKDQNKEFSWGSGYLIFPPIISWLPLNTANFEGDFACYTHHFITFTKIKAIDMDFHKIIPKYYSFFLTNIQHFWDHLLVTLPNTNNKIQVELK